MAYVRFLGRTRALAAAGYDVDGLGVPFREGDGPGRIVAGGGATRRVGADRGRGSTVRCGADKDESCRRRDREMMSCVHVRVRYLLSRCVWLPGWALVVACARFILFFGTIRAEDYGLFKVCKKQCCCSVLVR